MARKGSYASAAAALALAATVVTGAMASPLAGPAAAPSGPLAGLVLVQGTGSLSERMQRLGQHRAILEDALAPRHAMPAEPPPAEPPAVEPPAVEQAEPPQPLTRSLQRPPEVAEPAESQPIGEAHGAISCEAAAAIVADYGFSDIHPTDCSGELYSFSAFRDGTEYALTVTAADGEITEVSRQ